jgi:hypothetical protein
MARTMLITSLKQSLTTLKLERRLTNASTAFMYTMATQDPALHNLIANLCNNNSSLAQWTANYYVRELAAQPDWQLEAILTW